MLIMRMTITPYANYADDNTPYAINVDKLIESLENDSSILIKWVSHNDLVINHHDNVSLVADKEIIEGGKVVKLLGITIDNKLNFSEHVMKHHALVRISNVMCQQKLTTLLKAFIEFQFSYCPLV